MLTSEEMEDFDYYYSDYGVEEGVADIVKSKTALDVVLALYVDEEVLHPNEVRDKSKPVTGRVDSYSDFIVTYYVEGVEEVREHWLAGDVALALLLRRLEAIPVDNVPF